MMLTSKQSSCIFCAFIATGLWLSSCGEAAKLNADGWPNAQQHNNEAFPGSIERPDKRKETANPGKNETVRTAVFKGTLQAIFSDSREVTMLLDDGKRVKVKVGKGSDDFTRLKPGNRVSFELREAAEIVGDTFFHPETGEIVERFPPGSIAERELPNPYYHRTPSGHHVFDQSEIIEVPAIVVSVNVNSRTIDLVTYENRHFTVNVSDKRMDITGLESNEPVVAGFKEIDHVHVIELP